MKKLFSLLFLLFSLNALTQTISSLQLATKKFYEVNYLMDFETVASLSYPKIAEKSGPEKFLENLENHYENPEFRLRLQLETVPFQFSIIKTIQGKSFCVITCRNPMRYFFETKLTTETATEKATWLKEINKTKEVTFEPNRNSFNVKKISTFVAVIDETTNKEWKFFNFDMATQYDLFEVCFGKDTKKELGL
ncbi:hypothetical protein [Flavobacterium sp. N1994]|uniref:hypothetical protein n=1 Tax=Flavobacterium sp. N1994 TaxID=2986827 RepID=UPI0022220C5B|nr:hypothetical protein [Flavobacterium sp. N1994]